MLIYFYYSPVSTHCTHRTVCANRLVWYTLRQLLQLSIRYRIKSCSSCVDEHHTCKYDVTNVHHACRYDIYSTMYVYHTIYSIRYLPTWYNTVHVDRHIMYIIPASSMIYIETVAATLDTISYQKLQQLRQWTPYLQVCCYKMPIQTECACTLCPYEQTVR